MDKKKILIIDDSESLCEMMKAVIEGNGSFEVCTEINSSQALVRAKEYGPDLIILDVLMPEMDGVTLAVHLRSDPQLKEIPVMFLTSLAKEGDFIFGSVFGGYHVLSKGASPETVIEAIQANLAKKEKPAE